MATYTFYPPQVMEAWPTRDRFWKRVVSPRGVGVLINGASMQLLRVLTEDEIRDSDYAFGGGREHQVSEATKDVLTGFGFPIITKEEAITLSDQEHNGHLVEN